MIIFTIGFTKKNAREFFTKLKEAGVKRVIDVRLKNVSQLAGFTKKEDLEYFLDKLAGIKYHHHPEMAPTKDILDDYKKKNITWLEYERRFNELIADRNIESLVTPEKMDDACLLCSEPLPDKCHRRLVAEYFQQKWDQIEICHL